MYYLWRSKLSRGTPATYPVIVGLLGLFSVLMVIFLVCSQRISMPGTAIDLPRFDNEEITPVVKTVVTVTASGKLFYNAKLLDGIDDFHDVMQDLAARHRAEESRVVVFYADRKVPLDMLAQLFDIARGVNFDAYLATSGASLRTGKNNAPATTPDDKSL